MARVARSLTGPADRFRPSNLTKRDNFLKFQNWLVYAEVTIKGRVWSKIIFCVWLAFAVEIVVAMNAELNLAWITRYEPPASTVMTSLPSPSLGRALYNIGSSIKNRVF